MVKRKIINVLKNHEALWAFIIVFALIGGYALSRSSAAVNSLASYYPDTPRYLAGYYLEGVNYEGANAPSRSVLWFKNETNGYFKQYDYAPYGSCHWDQLQWSGGYLKYTETNDQCGGNDNQVVLSPIIFMPASWASGNSWRDTGKSNETHYDHGRVVCRGSNSWNSKVLGWEQIDSNTKAIHTQTNEFTTWTYGSAKYGCVVGQTQWWQENFYLTPSLKIAGTNSYEGGLKRSMGGNANNYKATGHWDWNVWFTYWNKLP